MSIKLWVAFSILWLSWLNNICSNNTKTTTISLNDRLTQAIFNTLQWPFWPFLQNLISLITRLTEALKHPLMAFAGLLSKYLAADVGPVLTLLKKGFVFQTFKQQHLLTAMPAHTKLSSSLSAPPPNSSVTPSSLHRIKTDLLSPSASSSPTKCILNNQKMEERKR